MRLELTKLTLCLTGFLSRKSITTRKNYRHSWVRFQTWSDARSVFSALCGLFSDGQEHAEKQLSAYRKELEKRYEEQRVVHELQAFYSAHKALHADGLIDWPIVRNAPKMRPQHWYDAGGKPVKTLPKLEQIVQLRQQVALDKSVEGTRDQALLSVLVEAMLGVKTLLSLNVSDIDLANSVLRIRARNKPNIYIPLSRITVGELNTWLRYRPKIQSSQLFTRIRGSSTGGGAMDSLSLQAMLGKRFVEAGLPRLRVEDMRKTSILEVAKICCREKYSSAAGRAVTREKTDTLFPLISQKTSPSINAAIIDALSNATRGKASPQ